MSFWSSCVDHAPLLLPCLSQQGFLIALALTLPSKTPRVAQTDIEGEKKMGKAETRSPFHCKRDKHL